MSHEPTKLTLTQQVLKHWPLVVVAVSSIVAWTTMKTTVEGQTDDIRALKITQEQQGQASNQILVQLAAIQTDLQWIKSQLK